MTFYRDRLKNMQDVLASGTGKYRIRWKDGDDVWHDGPACFIEKSFAEDQAVSALRFDYVVEAEVEEE